MSITRRGLSVSLATLPVVAAYATPALAQQASQDGLLLTSKSEADAAEMAVEAYVYGYPLVTMEMTRRVLTNVPAAEGARGAPMGQFTNLREYPDAKFRAVTAPNADTLYSTAFLDLAKEPYVLTVPNEEGRYFLLPMLSAWTNVFAVPGKRTTGTGGQTYLIAGPGWSGDVPAGAKLIPAPTNIVWILGRTYCSGTPEDYRAVHAIQDQYKLVPLSAHGKPYTPPAGKVDSSIDTKTAVRTQVHRMSGVDYFTLLATLLKENPPALGDGVVLAKMSTLGIVPGEPFHIEQLSPSAQRAIEQAPALGVARIMGHERQAGEFINGWTFSRRTGDYGADYLQRAFVTAVGLGANLPQDAIYPLASVDAVGRKFNGSSQYVLRFPAGETPPVNGFWSLTMYDQDFFFVDNPINRYTVSPRDNLKANADGSIDLLIQHASPGAGRESNWLPAPKGPFTLMMRTYWPQNAVLNGSWAPPGVQQVG